MPASSGGRAAVWLLGLGVLQLGFVAVHWRESAAMRDRELGRYLGMDPQVVWQTDAGEVLVADLRDRARRAHLLACGVPLGLGGLFACIALAARRQPLRALGAAAAAFVLAHAGAVALDRAQWRRGVPFTIAVAVGLAVASVGARRRTPGGGIDDVRSGF